MAVIAAAGLLLGATPSHAKQASFADREQARQLGAEGLQLYEAGAYEEALDRFDRANALFPAPTLGLRAARCLAKLGRLVEASERYLEVSRTRLTRQSPQVHFAARRDARDERDALLPLIPSLEVDVPAADPEALLLRVDGERVPAALIGEPQPLDPGDHAIFVQLGQRHLETHLSLARGEHTRIVLQLADELAGAASPSPSAEPSPHRQWGYITLGVGGAFALVGAANGLVTILLHDQLSDTCPNDECPPAQHGTNDILDVTGPITTVTLTIGALGLAAGATLLLVDPNEDDELHIEPSSAAVRVRPWIGPGSVGIVGQF